jgi:hypothetical protein
MEAAVLALSPIQPPEAPSKHEALVTLAKYRRDLENTPSNERGDWHSDAQAAFAGILAIEGMVARLLEISAAAPSQDASEAIDYAIDVLVESAGTVTAEAARRAEEDAPPYNSEDYWPRYRG